MKPLNVSSAAHDPSSNRHAYHLFVDSVFRDLALKHGGGLAWQRPEGHQTCQAAAGKSDTSAHSALQGEIHMGARLVRAHARY